MSLDREVIIALARKHNMTVWFSRIGQEPTHFDGARFHHLEDFCNELAESVAAKAGEVMREKAIACFFPFGIKADDKIRTLPGVTLEDIK